MIAVLEDTPREGAGRVLDSRPAGEICDVEWVQRVLAPVCQLGVVEVDRPAQALAAWIVAEQLAALARADCCWRWGERSNVVDQDYWAQPWQYRCAAVE